jgi:hypothetical protein
LGGTLADDWFRIRWEIMNAVAAGLGAVVRLN